MYQNVYMNLPYNSLHPHWFALKCVSNVYVYVYVS
jgi:hypothetical protein